MIREIIHRERAKKKEREMREYSGDNRQFYDYSIDLMAPSRYECNQMKSNSRFDVQL